MKNQKKIGIGLLFLGLLLGLWIWAIGFHEGKYSSKETPFNVPQRIVQSLNENAKMEGQVPALEARFAQLALGTEAPGFSGPSLVEGQSVSLADYRGKQAVLLEFWSSWCGDCRRFNGHLWDLYEATRGQDFEIISISMDRNLRSWKKAIAKDQLTWPQVCDGEGVDSELMQAYGISLLPMNFLIDKEGKIVGKHLSVDEIKQWLATNN